jgi:hypothetical protein
MFVDSFSKVPARQDSSSSVMDNSVHWQSQLLSPQYRTEFLRTPASARRVIGCTHQTGSVRMIPFSVHRRAITILFLAPVQNRLLAASKIFAQAFFIEILLTY